MLLAIGLCALTGCGSDDYDYSSPTVGDSTSSAASPTPTAPPTTTTGIGQYTASDDDGDQVDVEVSLGEPSLASDADDSDLQMCADRLSSFSRSVVIPVIYEATIKSSLSGDVHLHYGAVGGVLGDDGQFNQLSPQFWATTYRNSGDQCANPQDYDSAVGDLVWTNARPGARLHFVGLLIADDVLTPNAPDAADFARTVLLDTPGVRVDENDLDVTLTSGTNLVSCGASGTDPAAGGRLTYVAEDPDTATSHGCTG